MGVDFVDVSGFAGRWPGYRHHGFNKVLLREPERCDECTRIFISLYPVTRCLDHEGLDEV